MILATWSEPEEHVSFKLIMHIIITLLQNRKYQSLFESGKTVKISTVKFIYFHKNAKISTRENMYFYSTSFQILV